MFLGQICLMGTVLLCAASAQAIAFTPKCTNYQYVDMPLNTSSGSYLRETNLNLASGIQNNVDTVINMWANSKVSHVYFTFGNFNTEANYDYVEFSDRNNGSSIKLTGNLGLTSTAWKSMTDMQRYGGRWLFHSDTSVASQQVWATAAVTYCNQANTNTAVSLPLIPGRRNLGLLTGTDDVVYLRMNMPSSTAKQMTVVMWSETSGVDFDLYARCGSNPTPTVYSRIGFSSAPTEFITIPPTLCAPNTAVFLAVHSYNGAGSFNLVASDSFIQTAPMLVSTNFNASAAQLNTFATTMRNGLKEFYGMTEGGYYIPTVSLCNQGKCAGTPRVVFSNTCTRSSCGRPGNCTICTDGWNNPRVIAHELGHGLLALVDEYQDVSGVSQANCGHTQMAGYANMHNICISSTHLRDATNAAIAAPSWMATSGWSQLNCAADTWPTCAIPSENRNMPNSPDNYDYQSHPMSGAFTVNVTY